jgi:hypothetical protein
MVIKRVSPLSAGKIGGVLYALLGLVIGAVVSLVVMAAGGAASMASDDAGGGAMMGAMFGAGAIIVLPIVYGICGFIFTLISAVLYNIAAKMAGGIEVDVQ